MKLAVTILFISYKNAIFAMDRRTVYSWESECRNIKILDTSHGWNCNLNLKKNMGVVILRNFRVDLIIKLHLLVGLDDVNMWTNKLSLLTSSFDWPLLVMIKIWNGFVSCFAFQLYMDRWLCEITCE